MKYKDSDFVGPLVPCFLSGLAEVGITTGSCLVVVVRASCSFAGMTFSCWAWSSETERMKGAAAFGGGFVWSSPGLEARLVVILWFEAAVWRCLCGWSLV
ncbi:hypothetical protein KY289_013928 [Solanum tuberosum]|nr:hypothetical protein KY289_013928 [Solanum tuberosum]